MIQGSSSSGGLRDISVRKGLGLNGPMDVLGECFGGEAQL